MPTDTGRALSLQQQMALEAMAAAAAGAAVVLLRQMTKSVDQQEADRLAAQYEVLLAGAMVAAAKTRVGYLQAYAAAEGIPAFEVPDWVLRPSVQDVLVGGSGKLPPPVGIVPTETPPAQIPVRAPSAQGGMRAALAELARDIERADAMSVAEFKLADATEATVMATTDWVDAAVIGPARTIAAMRRVAHPGACERCLRVSGVLVFKSSPRPRHPQCRCSFEPVRVDDPDYQSRLRQYQRNANTYASSGPGGTAWARQTRTRGRRQTEAATYRETAPEFQAAWTSFLKDEQVRLSGLVKTIPSDTYRNWAIMTSANMAETAGGDLLPVITRNG